MTLVVPLVKRRQQAQAWSRHVQHGWWRDRKCICKRNEGRKLLWLRFLQNSLLHDCRLLKETQTLEILLMRLQHACSAMPWVVQHVRRSGSTLADSRARAHACRLVQGFSASVLALTLGNAMRNFVSMAVRIRDCNDESKHNTASAGGRHDHSLAMGAMKSTAK